LYPIGEGGATRERFGETERMRRAVVLTLLMVVVPCSTATACSIVRLPPGAHVRPPKLAVYVEVRTVRTLSATPVGDERWEATVRRLRTFRGRPPKVFRVRSHASGGSCGVARPKVGARFALLLDGPGPPYRIDLGSLTSLTDLRRARR
jgi:hypothetical protein